MDWGLAARGTFGPHQSTHRYSGTGSGRGEGGGLAANGKFEPNQSFATTTTRQNDRALVTNKKFKGSLSKWSSHNEYSHNAIPKQQLFGPRNRVHVVATVLSRVQL